MTDDDKARIEQMYEEGYTLSEISIAVGFARPSITEYLVRRGWHMVIPRRRPTKTREQALAWYEKGVDIKVITTHFHITEPTLYAWRRAADIPLRYPKMSGRPQRQVQETAR